ncbi:MAG: alanine racemase [Pseudomonadota bacterium]
MSRVARAVVDLGAVRHNLDVARRAAPDSRVMAAVKADAYGHGLARLLPALEAADALAVACLEEGAALRQLTQKPIVVLQGIHKGEQLQDCLKHDLQPVFHQEWQLRALAEWRGDGTLDVWLKIDSGMHRLGFEPEGVAAAWQALSQHPSIGRVSCMTHMATADDRSDDFTRQQLGLFDNLTAAFDAPRSAANSACVLGWPEAHLDWVRPGIMLYGASPFVDGLPGAEALKPAMRLSAPIIAIKHCQRGDPVGYGRSWVCPQPMRLGVVAIGYGDGYPRHANAQTPVWVPGGESHLVGRVSMDMIAVDLSGREAVDVGDEVVLWGPELPAERVAESLGSIAYELFCHIGGQVAFEYTGA